MRVTMSNQIQGFDNERELSISTSTIILDFEYFLPNVIDHLDRIYTHRYHQQCIIRTYLTLFSMTSSVLFWMIYWITYESCERSLSLEEDASICRSVFILQILIVISVGFSPILFILMVISWIIFACINPIDRIRKDFIGFKLEGITWKNQLDDYFQKQIHFSCCCCCSSRLRNQLLQRNFGYIILSPHGIIFDELFLSKYLIINGVFMDNGRILKLQLNKCRSKELIIYLPGERINRQLIEELRTMFHTLSP